MITWEEAEAAGLDAQLRELVGTVIEVDPFGGSKWFSAEITRCELLNGGRELKQPVIGMQFRAHAFWLPVDGMIATAAWVLKSVDALQETLDSLRSEPVMMNAVIQALRSQRIKEIVEGENGNSTDW